MSRAVWFPAQQREMFCTWWMALNSSFRASIRSLMASLVVMAFPFCFFEVLLEVSAFVPAAQWLRGGVKSETVVELFCRKSPGGVSHLPQRPQRSSPCLIRPPSRRGMFAVFPAVFHRPCELRPSLRDRLFSDPPRSSRGLPAAQAVCLTVPALVLSPLGPFSRLPRRPWVYIAK